jgi:hypothetical protein
MVVGDRQRVRGRGKREKKLNLAGEKLAKAPRSHRSSIRSMVCEKVRQRSRA